MKKKFETPEIEIIYFDSNDVITASGGCYEYGDKPGHGYGDKNHDHFGPPGHNK